MQSTATLWSQDKQLKSAWFLILEPWSPAEVKQAVAEQFREHKYWPDVTDISMRCPKRSSGSSDVAENRRAERSSFSAAALAKYNAEMDEVLTWASKLEAAP